MKTHRGCGVLPWLLVAMGLLMGRPGSVLADTSARHQSISMNAGETQVIDNLNPEAKPAVKVIENPNALVMHNDDPHKLVLLGAENGKWEISVKLHDGENVIYDVAVHSIRPSGAVEDSAALPADSSPSASAAAPAPDPKPADSSASVTAVPPPREDTVTSAPAPAEPPTASIAAAEGSSVIPSQTAAEIAPKPFQTDPGVIESGGVYSTEGVASSGGTHYLPADGLDLASGTSQVIDFPQRLRRVSIADADIADVQVVNPYQLNLIAHKPGFTTLTVWSGQGHYEERQVRVDPNGKQQVLLNCMVAELDRGRIEDQGANLSAALSKYGVSLVGLPGAVATPFSPQSSITAVLPNGTTVSGGNQSLPPGGALIPMLLSQNMTYGLSAQNSNVMTQSFFQFLEDHNMAKILAEPRMLANSGEKARFQSGGQIPIVIAQALNTSIAFKDFGTIVKFQPTVIGVNDIELLVNPEVSEPDYAHAVQMFGFTVPAFVTRSAETVVRLHDNQTLIIAGLILHDKKQEINKVPYLGDIPYIDGLFRTTHWTDSETDLVMSVTPQIVRPLPGGGKVFLPTSHAPLTEADIRTERLNTPDAARPRF